MEVTVAICTWNREELLDVTLSSLANLQIPSGVTWKVIVADNNSSDGTAEVVASHRNRLPIRRLFVRPQGKSHALNAVIECLEGDLVIWADDDVLIDNRWLASYVQAAQRHPEIGFFGGRINARFLEEEPVWLRPAWSTVCGIYAALDHGDEPFLLDENRLLYGANWAVRVPLHKKYRYDHNLGRCGELLLSGEETDVMRRMLADGHFGMWRPECSVDHLITPERMGIDAIYRYFFGYAESFTPVRASSAARLIYGAAHLCAALYCERIGSKYSPTSHPDLWMKYLMQSTCSWGHVEAYWKRFPAWLKPGPLKRLLQRRHQPRFATTLKPLLEKLRRSDEMKQAAGARESARRLAA